MHLAPRLLLFLLSQRKFQIDRNNGSGRNPIHEDISHCSCASRTDRCLVWYIFLKQILFQLILLFSKTIEYAPTYGSLVKIKATNTRSLLKTPRRITENFHFSAIDNDTLAHLSLRRYTNLSCVWSMVPIMFGILE